MIYLLKRAPLKWLAGTSVTVLAMAQDDVDISGQYWKVWQISITVRVAVYFRVPITPDNFVYPVL